MIPTRFMIIAGEASGDELAAELVRELRVGIERRVKPSSDAQPAASSLAPQFFGAGGPHMAAAGVELVFDLTQHSVIGLDMLKTYFKFRQLLHELLKLAKERQPHVIICVDFSLFNGVFASAIKKYVRARRGPFNNWQPKVIKYISPQVWASREERAYAIARDFDLLLTIFPFEPEWYAARVPKLRVEFVGHPMMERYASAERGVRNAELEAGLPNPSVVLLPGSRRRELERHFPVMLGALAKIQTVIPGAMGTVVLPNEALLQMARGMVGSASVKTPPQIQIGGLADALSRATVAISKTGTVTMECACFGVPTVTLYKTSWSTYQIGKRIVKVKSLTMPNLLANEAVFPEFVQNDATVENISQAVVELLSNQALRQKVQTRLAEVIASLGGSGASRRAAEAILKITPWPVGERTER